MRAFTDAHTDWLTVVRLPAYAPDLNPVEGRQTRPPLAAISYTHKPTGIRLRTPGSACPTRN